MKLTHNGINEIVAAGKVVLCENSGGEIIISPAKGSEVKLEMTEHGTVIATTENHEAASV